MISHHVSLNRPAPARDATTFHARVGPSCSDTPCGYQDHSQLATPCGHQDHSQTPYHLWDASGKYNRNALQCHLYQCSAFFLRVCGRAIPITSPSVPSTSKREDFHGRRLFI